MEIDRILILPPFPQSVRALIVAGRAKHAGTLPEVGAIGELTRHRREEVRTGGYRRAGANLRAPKAGVPPPWRGSRRGCMARQRGVKGRPRRRPRSPRPARARKEIPENSQRELHGPLQFAKLPLPSTAVNDCGKDTACIGCRTMLPTENPEANRRTASESRMREIRPSGPMRGRRVWWFTNRVSLLN